MFREQAAIHITQVMGVVHLHVRTCRCARFKYLGNGRTDCAVIWCVIREPLAKRFTKVDVMVRARVQLYPEGTV